VGINHLERYRGVATDFDELAVRCEATTDIATVTSDGWLDRLRRGLVP
jgi:hypothetical protein